MYYLSNELLNCKQMQNYWISRSELIQKYHRTGNRINHFNLKIKSIFVSHFVIISRVEGITWATFHWYPYRNSVFQVVFESEGSVEFEVHFSYPKSLWIWSKALLNEYILCAGKRKRLTNIPKMDFETSKIVSKILSQNELDKLPVEIVKKIDTYFEQRFEEFLVSEAVSDEIKRKRCKIFGFYFQYFYLRFDDELFVSNRWRNRWI